MKKRIHAIVHGLVQGVFFRANTKKVALELNLGGWVRNCDDGSVELVAEGEEGDLRSLLEWCKKGPQFARVDKVLFDWEAAKNEFQKFEIVH